MSEAAATDVAGHGARIVKGAYAVVAAIAEELQANGFRVLAAAIGPAAPLRIAGLIALSDPPRAGSAVLIKQLKDLGIRTMMVTGDSAITARVVADAVGVSGAIGVAARLADGAAAGDDPRRLVRGGGRPRRRPRLRQTGPALPTGDRLGLGCW